MKIWTWIRGLCALLAIGSFVGGGVYLAVVEQAEQTEQRATVIIILAVLGWFFIAVAIGGKKGLIFGIGLLIFAACVFGVLKIPQLLGSSYNWPAAKHYLDTLIDKPGEIVLLYVGLIALIVLLIITPPIIIARLIVKFINRRTQTQSAAQGSAPVVSGGARRRREPDVGDTEVR